MATNNISLGVTIGAALSGSFGSAFRTANERANSLGRSLQQVRLGRTAAQDVSRLNQELATLRTRQAAAGTGDQALNRQIAETERQLNRARLSAERYGVNLHNLTGENNRLANSERVLGASLARNNILRRDAETRSRIGSSMMGTVGVAAGAAFALSRPLKESIDFESAMADVRKASDLTNNELTKLGNTIIKQSTIMPMSATGIASITEMGLKAGIAKNEILDFQKATIKMGVAFDMTGQDAGETMTAWRSGMSLTQKQANALADAINFLDANTQGTASTQSISEVVKRIGALAKSSGLNEIKAAALGTAFLSPGTAPDVAATGMKNFLNALNKGRSANKRETHAFEDIGFTPERVAVNMQKDAEKTIMGILKALSKSPAVSRNALVGDLFGEEAKMAIMPLIANLDNAKTAFDAVSDASKYAGSMTKEYGVRSKTTANDVQLLGNQFSALAIKIGDTLKPSLDESSRGFGGMVMATTDWIDKNQTMTRNIIGAAFGLAGLKIGLLAGGYALTVVSSGFTMAGSAMAFFTSGLIGTRIGLAALSVQAFAVGAAQKAMAAWTGVVTAAQWAWNVALSANPIGLVVIGITAFGALAYTVYKNWEPIMTYLRESFAWLGTAVDKVMGYAGTVGNAFSSFGKFMTTPIVGTGAGTKGGLSSFGGTGAGTKGSLSSFAGITPNASLPKMATASGPQVSNNHQSNVFNITQKPGQSSEEFADHVIRKLTAKQNADKRGALHD
ncbi:MAG: phage tail tape measure protein [Methylococcales bacterium]|nr:phage tail tape measure protein [Methylococcales bacterium]